MPTLVSSTPFPSAPFTGAPQIDVEWAPVTVPFDAPSWRSMVTQQDGVRGFRWKTGRQQELDQFVTGSGSVTVENYQQQYDPDNTGSPVSGMVVPNRQIRIVARIGNTTLPIAWGYIDSWPETNQYPGEPTFTIPFSDGTKLLARTALPSSFYELIVSTDQPSHRYHLNEAAGVSTVIDSGFAATPIPGLVSGNVTLGTAGLVTYNASRTCAAFDGTGSYINLQGDPGSSAVWAVELWINSSAFNGADATPKVIFDSGIFGGGTGTTTCLMMLNDSGAGSTGKLEWIIDDLGGSPNVTTANNYSGGVHHVVLVRDNPTCTLYIDGVSIGTASVAATFSIGQGFVLGAPSNFQTLAGTSMFWPGSIQEFAYYDGTLTAAQVADHYNAGANALSGEGTGTRVGRVLNFAGWPSLARTVDAGSSAVGAFDLQSSTAQDYVQTLAVTEQGRNYIDGQGNYTFQSRSNSLIATRSATSQATFTDQPGAGLQYAQVIYETNEQYVYNDVRVTRQGGNTQQANDLSSRRSNGPQAPFARTGLYVSDAAAQDCADWILSLRSAPKTRVTGLVFQPFADTTLASTLLGLQIGDRVTLTRRVAAGVTNTSDYTIEGIEDSFQQQNGQWSWVRTLRIWQAEVGNFGVWDTSTWDNADWVF